MKIEPIYQRDPRWKDKKLGTSTSTIGKDGCNLCCHSMLLRYYGYDYLPDALNALYVEKGVYQNGNLIDFWRIPNVFPDITADQFIQCPDTPAPLDLINTYLANKMPVIALVDFDKETQGLQTHFVLIVDKTVNDYLINDPMGTVGDGSYFFSTLYGSPSINIMGIRLYSGIVPQEVPPVMSPANSLEVEKKINELSEKVVENTNQVNTLSDKVSEVVRKISDIQTDITTIYKDRDTLAEIKQKITENTNAINSVTVSNTKSTTDLKGEIRTSKELIDYEAQLLEKRIIALEKGHQITNGKFEYIKKLIGKFYLVKIK